MCCGKPSPAMRQQHLTSVDESFTMNHCQSPRVFLSQRDLRLLTSVLLLGGIMAGCSLPNLLVSANSPSATPTPATIAAKSKEVAFQGQSLPLSAQITINNQVIQLEVAETPEQQQMGLMYRDSLADDRGMLFPFRPARQVGFWMKNVQIPLDMVFLRDGVVAAIEANVPPCQTDPCPVYGPAVKIDQVIELAGGRAAALGIRSGDRLQVEPR